jgi:monoamine oxidase
LKKNSLSLKSEVQEIIWKSEAVLVRYRHKNKIREIRAPKVLITVPLPLLHPKNGIKFSPALPLDRQGALEKVLMGSASKVVFTFKNRFWEERKEFRDLVFLNAPELPFPVWWTALSARLPLLTGWVGGPAAKKLNSLTKAEVKEKALYSLSRWLKMSVPRLKKELISFHYHNWDQDPFSQGAYSYIGIDGLAAQRLLARPLKRQLFFAGEATHTDGLNGTVDGAISTGLRAAAEVIRALKR